MSSEQVGKHKGAVETLLHEKKELSRILQIVNSQLQRHLSALEDAGVDTDQFIDEIQQQGQRQQTKSGQSVENSRQERESSQSKDTQRSQERNQSKENIQEGHEEDDAEDLLEDEGNNFSDRDFSPR